MDEKGIKYDELKPKLHYLPVEVLFSVSRVFEYGARKYDDWNWMQGLRFSRLFNSVQRHMWAWLAGKDVDNESGLHSIDHAICGLMMLRWMIIYRRDLDDRPDYYCHKEQEES